MHQRRTLGDCPHCNAEIPGTQPAIEYREDGRWPTICAECPDCLAVVHPR